MTDIIHVPRLTHSWDLDKKAGVFFCGKAESLFFSSKVRTLATCGKYKMVKNQKGNLEEVHVSPGCGATVLVKVYDEHAKRWTEFPISSPQYWAVDRVFNEVVAPCKCKRCHIRRVTQPNYEGLTGKPLEV